MEIDDFEDLMKLDGTNLDELGLSHLVNEYVASPDDGTIFYSPKRYSPSPVQVVLPKQDFGEDMFDPTGFIPLEVMIEQQKIAGRKALIQKSMFDFEDWKDIYLDTEPPVDFDDDFQVMEYIREIERKKDELFKERQQELDKEFSAFLASKRNKNATTTTNDDDVKISSNQESDNSSVVKTPSTEV